MRQEMSMEPIPIAGPWITQKEIDFVQEAVTYAWYEKANDYQSRFERAFAVYIGRQFAVCLPSCTSALHLALLALKIGPGDEVIVPDLTWIATSAPIAYVGATPIFADVDEKSWCLSAASFESYITPKTKAVVVVDLYGNMPDMDAILTIADRYGIAVIEDAAEAIGSEYKNKKAGGFGTVSAFSFHGSKTLTTGEGGMLLTDREDIYERCLFLRDHGRNPEDKEFWNEEVAYKYKMSSMQAALGLAQLERIEELVDRKLQIFSWYEAALRGVSGITLNSTTAWVKNSYWMVTVILDSFLNLEKGELGLFLKQKGISTRPFFYPLSQLPAYKGKWSKGQRKNSTALKLSPYGLNLPSAMILTKTQVQRVADVLRDKLT